MSKALKIISNKWPLLIKYGLLVVFLMFGISCQTPKIETSRPRLTERELIYEKGKALFENGNYRESSVFFLKVTQSSLGPEDEVYNQSLWKLVMVYEKSGDFEKAILALLELENRKSMQIPLFHIQLALAKNYLRLENKDLAFKIEKEIDQSSPARNYSLKEIYAALEQNSDFNYDHLIIEELQFLGKIQKYYIFVMESSESSINKNATDLLIHIYDGFFKILAKDTVNPEFKKNLSIELLEQLRKFDLYKLSTININPYTISKFSNYSEQKQKFLIDWLHQ